MVEVQEPAGLKCKNRPPPYSEETHTSETQPASQLADAQFAQELQHLVNGYQHPAGRWIEGWSRVRLSDGLLLTALVQASRDRGLNARDVAAVWARKALPILKRAARADDSDAYFRKALLDELASARAAPREHVSQDLDGIAPAIPTNPDTTCEAPLDAGDSTALADRDSGIEPNNPDQVRDFVNRQRPPCFRCQNFGCPHAP